MSGGVKRKYTWDDPVADEPDDDTNYLETYITEAKLLSEEIKDKYRKGLNKRNVAEFHDFTATRYLKLEDLLFQALRAGEVDRDEYDEICVILDKGKQKCEQKAAVIYGI
jgi:hypothetical protein